MARLISKFITLRLLWSKLGTKGLLRYLYSRYIKRDSHDSIRTKTDIVGFYGFLRYAPFGHANHIGVGEKTVNWVIPDFGIGSGGHLNIFRLIAGLEKLGYKCRIVIVGGCQFASAEDAHRSICKHFVEIKAVVGIGEESLLPARITVATSWVTAYTVRNFQGSKIKCYFVQDFEPFFYPLGAEYAFAEQTYYFGFYGITAGKWLAEKLAANCGMRTSAIGFSYDRNLYRQVPRRNSESRHVFFYARPVTSRRGFELGLLVLAEVSRRLPDVHFILAGWDTSSYAIPFPHLNAGNVPLHELPDLYSQCDAALVLSFTNLSLLPLELMACGCPVVSNNGPNVEWLLNDQIAVLANATVEDLSDAIIGLLENENLRRTLVASGLRFVETTSWSQEAENVAKIFEDLA